MCFRIEVVEILHIATVKVLSRSLSTTVNHRDQPSLISTIEKVGVWVKLGGEWEWEMDW